MVLWTAYIFLLHHGNHPNTCNGTLWNPATRESRPLHVPNEHIPPDFHAHFDRFAFGRDPLTDEYNTRWFGLKICVILHIARPTGNFYYLVAICRLGNDSWRYLDPKIPSFGDVENVIDSSGICYV